MYPKPAAPTQEPLLLAIFVTSHLAGCAWAIIGLREFQATFVASNMNEHTRHVVRVLVVGDRPHCR